MTKKRPSFTPEFKQEATSLVLDKDYSIAEASTAMGVGNTGSGIKRTKNITGMSLTLKSAHKSFIRSIGYAGKLNLSSRDVKVR